MDQKTVSDYIAAFPKEQQGNLKHIHELIRSELPDTSDALKWGAPAAIEKDGMILAIFSGHKQHINFVVTPSTKDAFSNNLAEYSGGKGSIQLRYDKPIPEDLLREMLQYRLREYRQHGVKWK